MKMKHIDNGFYEISVRDASKLADKHLPDHGKEKLVVHEGQHYWLARTRIYNIEKNEYDIVWSIRKTDWRLVNGVATLGGQRNH